mmetsp:Transcript_14041/g.28050  ORF Transcript_14041/g.28050 Transcript_14041/m.28050 type:complete len:256 (-) Transcript_14041:388-1155(-)
MEDPFWPQHPQQSFGCRSGQMDSSCRVEELAQALHASTVISPNRYSWISPEQLCADLRTQPVVIIDVRENKERDGGHIKGSIRCGVLLSSAQMDDLASRWREGAHIVFTCIRSLSRAPLAAQRLIQHLDQMGNAPFPTGVEPRVSLLDGGIVGFVEYLFRQHGSGGTLAVSQQDDLLAAILAGFDQSMWTVGYFPEGARAAHVSELGDFGPGFGGAREEGVERLVVEEASEELSYLMGHSLSLSPPPAPSMPYIS